MSLLCKGKQATFPVVFGYYKPPLSEVVGLLERLGRVGCGSIALFSSYLHQLVWNWSLYSSLPPPRVSASKTKEQVARSHAPQILMGRGRQVPFCYLIAFILSSNPKFLIYIGYFMPR